MVTFASPGCLEECLQDENWLPEKGTRTVAILLWDVLPMPRLETWFVSMMALYNYVRGREQCRRQ